MLFAAILIAAFFGRAFHGCLKYLVIAALFIWLTRSDPILANKMTELLGEFWKAFREFVMGL